MRSSTRGCTGLNLREKTPTCFDARFAVGMGFPIGIMLLGSVDTLLEVGLPLRLPPGRGDLVGLFVEKVWRLLVPASGIWAWFGPRFVTALASVLLGAELFVTDSDILFLLTDVMVQSLLSLHIELLV